MAGQALASIGIYASSTPEAEPVQAGGGMRRRHEIQREDMLDRRLSKTVTQGAGERLLVDSLPTAQDVRLSSLGLVGLKVDHGAASGAELLIGPAPATTTASQLRWSPPTPSPATPSPAPPVFRLEPLSYVLSTPAMPTRVVVIVVEQSTAAANTTIVSSSCRASCSSTLDTKSALSTWSTLTTTIGTTSSQSHDTLSSSQAPSPSPTFSSHSLETTVASSTQILLPVPRQDSRLPAGTVQPAAILGAAIGAAGGAVALLVVVVWLLRRRQPWQPQSQSQDSRNGRGSGGGSTGSPGTEHAADLATTPLMPPREPFQIPRRPLARPNRPAPTSQSAKEPREPPVESRDARLPVLSQRPDWHGQTVRAIHARDPEATGAGADQLQADSQFLAVPPAEARRGRSPDGQRLQQYAQHTHGHAHSRDSSLSPTSFLSTAPGSRRSSGAPGASGTDSVTGSVLSDPFYLASLDRRSSLKDEQRH